MKPNWLLYLVIFSLALNFGTIGAFVYLHHQDQGRLYPGMPHPLPMRALWGALKLEDSQRQAVHGLLPEHRGKIAEIRSALFLKRQELFDLLKGEAPDMSKVRAKIGEISSLQGELEEEQVRFLLEIGKELKPAQKVAFLDLIQHRLNQSMAGTWGPRGWKGGRPGPMMGPGRGPGKPPDARGPGAPE
ncbi:MAG: Spy/CpxP family protein refolding chaperone [Desulfobaccales bacterium]